MTTDEAAAHQQAQQRRPAHLQLSDPEARLAAFERQFGEYGGVNASIEVSTTFTVLEADTLPQIFTGQKGPDAAHGGCYLYGRSFNPTVRYLGRQLAALEGGEAAYCCASGMSAIAATLLALCSSGDHIICSNAVYGGTFALMKDFLPSKCGITTTFVPISDLPAVAAAVTDRTRVIYTETLSNPTLVVADIPRLAAIARAKGLKLVVDNTFTPLILSPLRLGADVVVHSLTKFISGASDIIGGAVCAADGNFVNSLMDLHMGPLMLLGPTMDPKVASEMSLRIPHLALRVREHSARALFYAERLRGLRAKVAYPGLASHPQHALLQRLANPGYGFGGMLTLELPNLERAKLLMERLQNKHGFGLLAVSLGYFDTLMSASAASTSSELSDAELAKAGISGGLVRFSVGLTGSQAQRWEQLEESYRHVAGVPLDVKPAFKALQVTRTEGGGLKRTPSWHSFGTLEDTDTEEEADGTSVLTTEAAALLGTQSVKVRRLNSGAEIIYRRLQPQAAAAADAAATMEAEPKINKDNPPDLKQHADSIEPPPKEEEGPSSAAQPAGAAAAGAAAAAGGKGGKAGKAAGVAAKGKEKMSSDAHHIQLTNVVQRTGDLVDMVAHALLGKAAAESGADAYTLRRLKADIQMELTAFKNAAYTAGYNAGKGEIIAFATKQYA